MMMMMMMMMICNLLKHNTNKLFITLIKLIKQKKQKNKKNKIFYYSIESNISNYLILIIL
jgi:hypothetical protein